MRLGLLIFAFWVAAAALAFAQDAGPKFAKQQPPASPANGRENAEIQLGRALRAENPDVPKKFRGKFAAAVLGATLKTDGTFTDLTKLGGEDEFEDVALTTVSQWRYTPATLNGSPAEIPVFIAIRSDNKNMRTAVEPNLPFQTKPRTSLEEQFALQTFRGSLY